MSSGDSGVPIEMKSYVRNPSLTGGATATAVYLCDWDDRVEAEAQLLGNPDLEGYYADLVCTRCQVSQKKARSDDPDQDKEGMKAEFVCEYGSIEQAKAHIVDLAFKVRVEVGGMAITISGKKYVWDSGKPLKDGSKVQPVKKFTSARIVLYGRRSTFNVNTYSAYEDKINKDTFLGAAIGHVRFDSVSGTEVQLPNGSVAWDVEVHLEWQADHTWNEFFNEDTGKFEKIKNSDDASLIYSDTNFAGLLAAPTLP